MGAGCKNLAKAKVKGGTFYTYSVPVNSASPKTPLGYPKKETPKVPKLSK
jgi:hypothetical protein